MIKAIGAAQKAPFRTCRQIYWPCPKSLPGKNKNENKNNYPNTGFY
jgi:hypothetical protein